jgi:hypothetical protein
VKDFQEVSALPQQDPDASATVKVKYSDLSLEHQLFAFSFPDASCGRIAVGSLGGNLQDSENISIRD